jgi:5-methylcytosine-specific restriction protein A
MSKLEIGQVYDRKEVHQAAKDEGLPSGNESAGIVVVGEELTIFWNPFRRFYANTWIDSVRAFQYSGEGSIGPMKMERGNAALSDAGATQRPVRLFYKIEPTGSQWMYVGDYLVTDTVEGLSEDDAGNLRTDYRFIFELISSPVTTTDIPKPSPKEPRKYTEQELWELAEKQRKKSGGRRARGDVSHPQKRLANPAITAYARARAVHFGGTCELCAADPGWRTSKDEIHLQVHHVHPDIDLVDWVAAVCGTCHDRLHHATDRKSKAIELRAIIVKRQEDRGRPTTSAKEALKPSA